MGWLLQSTPNGSTYLQMIIMGCLLVCIIWFVIRQIKDFKIFVDEYKANKEVTDLSNPEGVIQIYEF